MNRLIGLFAFVALVAANDLKVGNDQGRSIVDERRVASPAIWKQSHKITYTTNNTDVISKIVVTDMRSDKDGTVKIIEGGVGHNNVTLELESPTIFRGYDFHIIIYAVADEDQLGTSTQISDTADKDLPNIPISVSSDIDDNLSNTHKNNVEVNQETPKSEDKVANEKVDTLNAPINADNPPVAINQSNEDAVTVVNDSTEDPVAAEEKKTDVGKENRLRRSDVPVVENEFLVLGDKSQDEVTTDDVEADFTTFQPIDTVSHLEKSEPNDQMLKLPIRPIPYSQ